MLQIPLSINKTGFRRDADLKESITNAIEMLLQTPLGANPSDPHYGFIFNNFRFEIFNEDEGTVYESVRDTSTAAAHNAYYDKKISGTSKNVNTFAIDLKNAIDIYEPRLENVNVSMSYVRKERQIYIRIRGIISSTQEPYTYDTSIRTWN